MGRVFRRGWVFYFDPTTIGGCQGDVAQLEEHRLCKPGVVGSSPIVSTLSCSDGV
jgi:hypothetical protein